MSYAIDTRKLAEIRNEIKEAILQKLQDSRSDVSPVASSIWRSNGSRKIPVL
ncbi:hypothetical protein [Shimazuella alba]|uniref:Uncharacterized protein n=1 Tax=Shimazuella alba TaxID=2690964 RepID=A0A6I4VYI2_9BACL|nr:hypothetical protein [Shimazuella alba]MXQ54990.1 hypothetical protein [Shimazuella alba]